LFLLDWLLEHEGSYITCPSTSPENRFKTREGGSSSIAMSSAMDLALIREVFEDFQKTCQALGIEDELLPDVSKKTKGLAPFKIGSKGQLLEWHEEFEEWEPGHRHISHLYGLFPSELFSRDKDLVEACRKSLELRLSNGGGHTGWSCAWIINVFAILGDSENSFKYLNTLLTRSSYDNLWDAHPPFQIDGNFGGTAGIANMLVQDRNGEVKILPALPKEFHSGYVKGLRIKNGDSVDIFWENGELKNHRIYK
jgi:alpha-L-fucosidase 2